MEISIHANANDNSEVIKWVSMEQLPAPVQELAENGNIWGVYLTDSGAVVAQDIWGEIHPTEIQI